MTTDQHEAAVKCYELGRQVPAGMVDGKVLLQAVREAIITRQERNTHVEMRIELCTCM